jgi:hypothetical protein
MRLPVALLPALHVLRQHLLLLLLLRGSGGGDCWRRRSQALLQQLVDARAVDGECCSCLHMLLPLLLLLLVCLVWRWCCGQRAALLLARSPLLIPLQLLVLLG